MSIEAYTAYRRASRRRSSRTPFNPLKSIENEIDLSGELGESVDTNELEDVGIKLRTEPFADFYTVESELGRGKFATVKKCRCNTTGQLYAAKVQRKRRKAKDARNELIHEIKMLAMCNIHPRIIGVKEVFETRHEIIIVTDFAAGGELFKYIEDTEWGFSESLVKQLLLQTLEALAFLHMRNVVHMDIKPQNILMTEESVHSDVILCDLGFSRTVNSGEDVREIVGTPDFVAPEVLSYEPINTSCDMWSVGVLTYMLLTGHSPFAGSEKMETFSNITQARVEFPDDLFMNVSEEAKDFISKLLIKNPGKRMTSVECLEHPWLEVIESSKSDSDDDVNEDKCKNDLSTIEECEFEKSVEEEHKDTSGNDVDTESKDNDEITNVSSDNKLLDHDCIDNKILDSEILENNNKKTVIDQTSLTNENCCKNETVIILTNGEHDNNKDSESSEVVVVRSEEQSTSTEGGNLSSIMEEVNENSSFNTDINDAEASVAEIDKLTVEIPLKESPSQAKALKELSNQRTALMIPSPLSSPIGCRRTLVPSPETIQENEPFKKQHCRRDSNEVKILLKSNTFKVEKSKILELDDEENKDTSAIVSKRGSADYHCRRTPIKTVRATKSLVTFYENLHP